MYVLSSYCGHDCLSMITIDMLDLVLELRHLRFETEVPVVLIIVFLDACLNWQEVVMMLLLASLGVCDRLDGCVEVLRSGDDHD